MKIKKGPSLEAGDRVQATKEYWTDMNLPQLVGSEGVVVRIRWWAPQQWDYIVRWDGGSVFGVQREGLHKIERRQRGLVIKRSR